ncbi:MAG: histidine kinase [Propionibacteriaceae bacterium]|nr:histidine kinase [Propionibacteriaceae bacterium]
MRWRNGLLLAALSLFVLPWAVSAVNAAWGALATVALLVPLWWRQTHADLVLGWLILLGGGQLLLGLPPSTHNVTYLVGLYSVAAYGRPRLRWLWLTVTLVGALVGAVVMTRDEWGKVSAATVVSDSVVSAAFLVAMAVLAWGVGRYVDQHRRLVQSQERQAEQQVRLALASQRQELARDVHDIVGHALALIAVQAESARYLAEAPEEEIALTPADRLAETSRTLTDIRRLAREALAETRTLTAELARDGEIAPVPGLGDITSLVERCRDSGLRVDYTPVAPEVGASLRQSGELALYRVAQEALTNIIKHAPKAAATVVVTEDEEGVAVRVSNEVNGPVAPGNGTGLAGLRRRVTGADGQFSAGVVGNRFEVEAWVPRRKP